MRSVDARSVLTKYEAVDVTRVSGNSEHVVSETRITGLLEFVPRSNGGAWLMQPVSFLVAENERNRKAKIAEIAPLSTMDRHLRVVLTLGKVEASRVLRMKPGEELVLTRKGWGRTWKQRIRCLPNKELLNALKKLTRWAAAHPRITKVVGTPGTDIASNLPKAIDSAFGFIALVRCGYPLRIKSKIAYDEMVAAENDIRVALEKR